MATLSSSSSSTAITTAVGITPPSFPPLAEKPPSLYEMSVHGILPDPRIQRLAVEVFQIDSQETLDLAVTMFKRLAPFPSLLLKIKIRHVIEEKNFVIEWEKTKPFPEEPPAITTPEDDIKSDTTPSSLSLETQKALLLKEMTSIWDTHFSNTLFKPIKFSDIGFLTFNQFFECYLISIIAKILQLKKRVVDVSLFIPMFEIVCNKSWQNNPKAKDNLINVISNLCSATGLKLTKEKIEEFESNITVCITILLSYPSCLDLKIGVPPPTTTPLSDLLQNCFIAIYNNLFEPNRKSILLELEKFEKSLQPLFEMKDELLRNVSLKTPRALISQSRVYARYSKTHSSRLSTILLKPSSESHQLNKIHQATRGYFEGTAPILESLQRRFEGYHRWIIDTGAVSCINSREERSFRDYKKQIMNMGNVFFTSILSDMLRSAEETLEHDAKEVKEFYSNNELPKFINILYDICIERDITETLRKRLENLKKSLPPGTHRFIDTTASSVCRASCEEFKKLVENHCLFYRNVPGNYDIITIFEECPNFEFMKALFTQPPPEDIPKSTNGFAEMVIVYLSGASKTLQLREKYEFAFEFNSSALRNIQYAKTNKIMSTRILIGVDPSKTRDMLDNHLLLVKLLFKSIPNLIETPLAYSPSESPVSTPFNIEEYLTLYDEEVVEIGDKVMKTEPKSSEGKSRRRKAVGGKSKTTPAKKPALTVTFANQVEATKAIMLAIYKYYGIDLYADLSIHASVSTGGVTIGALIADALASLFRQIVIVQAIDSVDSPEAISLLNKVFILELFTSSEQFMNARSVHEGIKTLDLLNKHSLTECAREIHIPPCMTDYLFSKCNQATLEARYPGYRIVEGDSKDIAEADTKESLEEAAKVVKDNILPRFLEGIRLFIDVNATSRGANPDDITKIEAIRKMADQLEALTMSKIKTKSASPSPKTEAPPAKNPATPTTSTPTSSSSPSSSSPPAPISITSSSSSSPSSSSPPAPTSKTSSSSSSSSSSTLPTKHLKPDSFKEYAIRLRGASTRVAALSEAARKSHRPNNHQFMRLESIRILLQNLSLVATTFEFLPQPPFWSIYLRASLFYTQYIAENTASYMKNGQVYFHDMEQAHIECGFGNELSKHGAEVFTQLAHIGKALELLFRFRAKTRDNIPSFLRFVEQLEALAFHHFIGPSKHFDLTKMSNEFLKTMNKTFDYALECAERELMPFIRATATS